ncbi:MAG: hypothetical protein H0U52_06170 [Chloroflexi bacterium]|nr:hypothetical protein [Chloroflexota bacterium]
MSHWHRRPDPRPTLVFDAYWRLAAERQAIFFKRLAGAPPPWTDDPVLRDFKFTNAYRASDRTSQYLIRHVIYEGAQAPRETFFRTILFKLFNRIETWEALRSAIGPLSAAGFDPDAYRRALSELQAQRQQVYSAAYIMPPVTSLASGAKHVGHIELLAKMLRENLPEKIGGVASLRDVYEMLLSYPSLGRFLAFQFAIDLNYGPNLNFDEDAFVVAGPGAQEGIAKCFVDRDGWSDEDIIRWTTDRQDSEFAQRGIDFRDLWGRRLKPIDCQNLFCEIAKYARVAHPGFTPPGGRSRIKQRFAARPSVSQAWYPPKWGLNASISVRKDDELALAQV